MTIVAAVCYEDGKPVRDIDITKGEKPSDGAFEWVGLFEPTDAEMDAAARRYGLHPLAVEDALQSMQIPKIESYGEQIFVIARTASLDDGRTRVSYGETAIFVGRHFIVSVRHGSPRGHKTMREKLETAPQNLKHGPDYVLHAIIDFVVDGYFPIVDTIEEHVLEMEDSLLEGLCSTMRSRGSSPCGTTSSGSSACWARWRRWRAGWSIWSFPASTRIPSPISATCSIMFDAPSSASRRFATSCPPPSRPAVWWRLNAKASSRASLQHGRRSWRCPPPLPASMA